MLRAAGPGIGDDGCNVADCPGGDKPSVACRHHDPTKDHGDLSRSEDPEEPSLSSAVPLPSRPRSAYVTICAANTITRTISANATATNGIRHGPRLKYTVIAVRGEKQNTMRSAISCRYLRDWRRPSRRWADSQAKMSLASPTVSAPRLGARWCRTYRPMAEIFSSLTR